MEEKAVELSTVIVSNKKDKIQTIRLGNSLFNGGVLETDTIYAGRSIGLLIDNMVSDAKKTYNFRLTLKMPAADP